MLNEIKSSNRYGRKLILGWKFLRTNTSQSSWRELKAKYANQLWMDPSIAALRSFPSIIKTIRTGRNKKMKHMHVGPVFSRWCVFTFSLLNKMLDDKKKTLAVWLRANGEVQRLLSSLFSWFKLFGTRRWHLKNLKKILFRCFYQTFPCN